MTTTSTSRRRPRRSAAKPPEPKFEQSGPVILRTCGFCCTRQPITALGRWGTSMACLDEDACKVRAAASGVYPTANGDEFALAQSQAIREALHGAIPRPLAPRRRDDADIAALRQANEQDRIRGAVTIS
jgi:hypothetical protein